MKLLTKEILGRLPKLGETSGQKDPTLQVKFFTPDAQWTWHGIEYDGKDIFFGFVIGLEDELGNFSLNELREVRGALGLPVERDKFFKPCPLSNIMRG